MEGVLLALIEQLNSSVVILLLLLVVVGWGLFKSGGLLQHFKQHDTRLDKVESIHSTVIELKTKIDLIYNNTNPRALVRSNSPLDLTPFGNKLAKLLDAENVFGRYEAKLIDAVNIKCPHDANAYDIQAASLDIARHDLPNLLNGEEINKFKDIAFNNGILLDDIWPVFGIYLRNKILDQRGIPVIEVDRNDPNAS